MTAVGTLQGTSYFSKDFGSGQGPCGLKNFIQNNAFAFLYYIFRQFTALFTIERDIKKGF